MPLWPPAGEDASSLWHSAPQPFLLSRPGHVKAAPRSRPDPSQPWHSPQCQGCYQLAVTTLPLLNPPLLSPIPHAPTTPPLPAPRPQQVSQSEGFYHFTLQLAPYSAPATTAAIQWVLGTHTNDERREWLESILNASRPAEQQVWSNPQRAPGSPGQPAPPPRYGRSVTFAAPRGGGSDAGDGAGAAGGGAAGAAPQRQHAAHHRSLSDLTAATRTAALWGGGSTGSLSAAAGGTPPGSEGSASQGAGGPHVGGLSTPPRHGGGPGGQHIDVTGFGSGGAGFGTGGFGSGASGANAVGGGFIGGGFVGGLISPSMMPVGRTPSRWGLFKALFGGADSGDARWACGFRV